MVIYGDEEAAGVVLFANVIEIETVGTFFAGHEKNGVVLFGEFGDFFGSVSDFTADGVCVLEQVLIAVFLITTLDEVDELIIGFQTLCGLRVKHCRLTVIDQVYFIEIADDQSVVVGLTIQTYYFCVTLFPENRNLRVVVALLEGEVLDALLQFENDGAGGINEGDVVLPCLLVGAGRFSVRSDEDGGVVQFGELLVADDVQTDVGEAFHFFVVVHDVAEAVERVVGFQILLCCLYGVDDAETEARFVVDKDFHSTSCLGRGSPRIRRG